MSRPNHPLPRAVAPRTTRLPLLVAVASCLGASLRVAAAVSGETAPRDVDALLEGKGDFTEMTLDDLLVARYDLASRTPLTLREMPGITTVITRDELVASGARDLLDVLTFVPGFQVTLDSESYLTVGVRGLWANDGRVLVMLDGHPLNESFYTGVRMDHRLPVELIERVEIVRGPGSVIYGGYAELAVVNVVTRVQRPGEHLMAVATLGRFDGDVGRNAVAAASLGLPLGEGGASVALQLRAGVAHGSADTYEDHFGERYRLTGYNARREPMTAQAQLSAGDLELGLLYDDFNAYARDVFEASAATPFRAAERQASAWLRYRVALGDRLELAPRLEVRRQQPWRVLAEDTPGAYYAKTADRATLSLHGEWRHDERLNVIAGVEGYVELARLDTAASDEGNAPLLADDGTETDHARYMNGAAYAQGQLSLPGVGTGVVGARYERHSTVGGSFVPRAAYTWVHGPLHAKLLASQAFRAPGVENFNLVRISAAGAPERTRPERTTVYELELGYKPASWFWGVVNLFDQTIRDPIVYSWDPATETEAYRNYPRTGTRGLECELRARGARAWLTLGFSYTSAAGKNRVPQYAVPVTTPIPPQASLADAGAFRPDATLGFARLKASALGSWAVHDGITLSLSAAGLGARYAYGDATITGDGELGELTINREPPAWVLGANVRLDRLGPEGLALTLGAHNLLDERHRIVQGYDGAHPPMPAATREVYVRVEVTP